MSRAISFWIGIPALVAIVAYCASPTSLTRAWVSRVAGAPIVECPETVNLGSQERGQVASAPLTIKNRGRSELVIDQVSSSCSCSGLEREEAGSLVPVRELRLAPGEEGHLQIRVSVNGIPGQPLRNSIGFHTNDPTSPQGRIEVLVEKVTGGLLVTPRTIAFGTVLVGQEACVNAEVRDPEPTVRSVESVTSSNPERLKVSWSPGEAGEAPVGIGSGTLLGHLAVSALTSDAGSLEGTIELHLAGRRPTTVSVVGRVAPLVEVSPALVVLPRTSNSGDVWVGTCLCRSNEHKPLSLSTANSDEGLSVRISQIEGNPHLQSIRIECNPLAPDKRTAPDQRMVRLKARVEAREIPVEIPVLCNRRDKSQ
jgi:hypothetical protein